MQVSVLLLLLSFLFLGCGDALPFVQKEELQEKYNKVLDELYAKSKDNIAGWPSDHDCDEASIKQY